MVSAKTRHLSRSCISVDLRWRSLVLQAAKSSRPGAREGKPVVGGGHGREAKDLTYGVVRDNGAGTGEASPLIGCGGLCRGELGE